LATTYQSPLANRPSAMTPFVVISLAGHAIAVGVVFAMGYVFEGPKIDLDQKPITASLVRMGKKRPEDFLPRKESAPPPEPEKVLIPTPGMKPDPKTKPSKEKTDAAKKSLFDALDKTAKQDEELEGEADGDPNGDSAKQEGEKYYGVIKAAVHRNYDVTNAIPEGERIQLKADIVIRLDAEGGLIDIKFASKSPNELFNEAVLRAVKKAAPFGPPPMPLRNALKKDGVQLRFTP
jgi:TonB family protein